MCTQPCPAGSIDDGATCRVPEVRLPKEPSYTLASQAPGQCPAGYDKDGGGAICYKSCKAGFHGNGPHCYADSCPAGFVENSPGLCTTAGPAVLAKRRYGRGVGKPPEFEGQCISQDDMGRARHEALTGLVKWMVAEPADAGKLVLPGWPSDF